MTSVNKTDWKFHLFGGLHVERDGKLLEIPPYRCQEVLIFLLLNFEHPIRRERLVGEVFPDLWLERGRARLSDHLWLIRSSIPGFEIKAYRDEIYINMNKIWLDCWEFSKLSSNNDPQSLRQAVELYKGDLVPDLYSDWLHLARERYHIQYLNSMRRLAQRLYEDGQYLRASEILECLVLEEPYDESAVRLLMSTLIRLGRRGLAISSYEKLRLLCSEHLSVQPEFETQLLYESILTDTTMTKPTLDILELPENDPEVSIQNAIRALNEGSRSEIFNNLSKIAPTMDPDVSLRRDLLQVDECIQWGEVPRAWQLLNAIQQKNAQVDLRNAILLIEQNNYSLAQQVLTRVLKASINTQDRELEAHSLIYLSKIRSNNAEFLDAQLAINRAIHIATKIDRPFLKGKGYLQKAKILYQQGVNNDVRDILLHAQTLSLNHHFYGLLAEINLLLASSYQRSGLYLNAYQFSNHALEYARDTGMKRIEAQILLGLAASCDFLGRKLECIQKLGLARTIYTDLNDPLGLAKVDYNLAAALPYHDERRCGEAIFYAQNALDVFLAQDQKEWQALAYTTMAFAMWVNGQHQEAILNYKRSMDLHKALGEYGFIPELLAYIGLANLGIGNHKEALKWTDRALQEQATQNLSDIVADIYYAYAQALECSGKTKEAVLYYKRAYQTLLDYAKDIEDEDARKAYFQRDPITRRLMKKVFELDLAPKPQQVLFRHKINGKQTETPEIILTVHAGPSDQAFAQRRGSKAMRQVRLERILKQTSHPHLKLSVENLAQALNVSKRTIQRDLVALRSRTAHITE